MPVPRWLNDDEFAALVGQAVLPLVSRFAPDALVVLTGADALANDPLTKLALSNGALWRAVEAVSAMFEEAAAVAMPGSARAGVVLRADFDPAADQVLADRIQVQQVMVNLLRNAVEAMAGRPRRELRIGCRARPDGLAQAYVADTGPGLDESLAERLFQPFVSGKAGGMGVGLAISRNIVESHGGAIWAEANAEGGATFHFTLKRAQSAA